MPIYNGQLNTNEVVAPLFNQIIAISTVSDNLKGVEGSLVERAKTNGGLYGDTKLVRDTDILKSYNWLNDAEASNLLKLYRPTRPKEQSFVVNQFRKIPVTIDHYMTKRAFMSEGSFSEFISVVLGWIRGTKRLYDARIYNTYIGTARSAAKVNTVDIPLSEITATGEEKNRLEAQMISQSIADLIAHLKNGSRNYNDYKFMRSYNEDDLVIVWNMAYVNKITKIDLPTIFHKDGLFSFDNTLLPEFFGEINTESGTTGASNTTIYSMVEKDFNTVDMDNPAYNPELHIFPGDLYPSSTAYAANETYTVDDSKIAIVMHKDSVPFMSSFEVQNAFNNPASLTETHYLIYGYNTLEYAYGKPFIVIESK